MKDRLTTAPLPLERPQGSCGTLNARSAFGTASGLLERPQGGVVKTTITHAQHTESWR